jgi:hypothetical protein
MRSPGWAALALALGLVALVIVFFRHVLFCLVGVGSLFDAWLARLWLPRYRRTGRLEAALRKELQLYHLRPRTTSEGPKGRGRLAEMERDLGRLSDKVSAALAARAPFCFKHEDLVIESGAPPDRAFAGNLVIIHLHQGWEISFAGRILGMDNVTVSDVVKRFVHLRLPLPVVGFRMPTYSLRLLNLAQEDDCLAMDVAIAALLATIPPRVRFVLSGECIAALRIERWMARGKGWPALRGRCAGVVLMTPVPNIGSTINLFSVWLQGQMRARIGGGRIPWPKLPLWPLLPLVAPNVKREEGPLPPAPDGVPVLVFFLEKDAHCSRADLPELRRRFPRGRIVPIPEGAADARGRVIGHGHCAHWPPLRQLLLDFWALQGPGVHGDSRRFTRDDVDLTGIPKDCSHVEAVRVGSRTADPCPLPFDAAKPQS